MSRAWMFALMLAWTGAGGAAAEEASGRRFRESCLGCHPPPDLRFATDRAWLEQIRRTS